ncbi:MAG: Methyl-accepting chemotaxis sensor/transducer protein [uncultured Paraburkholderia sp.]|nr:MAG: Methyl-accepting chemotaxis sensor/transducer protein [uncultured Paraburkholderia sp.]
MNFHHLSEKAKLTAAFGSLAVVVLIVSASSLIALNEANERFAGFVSGINARAQVAESLRNAVDARAMAVRNLVLVSSPADVDIEKAAVVDAEKQVEARLEQFNAMVAEAKDISETARSLAGEISRIEQLYRPVALQINSLALSDQRDAAVADIAAKCRPLLTALTKATNAYLEVTHERAKMMAQESAERFVQQRNLLIAFCIGAIALAIGAGIVITRGLMRALGAEPVALAEVTRRVAEGDLRSVPGASEAPAGSVLASMGEMQSSLVRLIGNVRSAADSIATGSSQIASGNVDLSSRTEQQASSLQETASSMEELTTTVKQNAENAQQASALSANASEVAMKGNGVVGEMVGTMGEISANSTRIAEITGLIEGIAFQTNILVLNAAVEAARAGEQGRGFAVVASEVRNLAQRSSSAAKEIKDLISTSVEKIRDGSSLADKAGMTMAEVTQAVARVTDIMGEIAAASAEQSRGIEQVNLAITQMDEVTQQNAALVEEAAAASKSLEDQGKQLNQSVSFFRLEGAEAGTQHASGAVQPAQPRARAASVRKTSVVDKRAAGASLLPAAVATASAGATGHGEGSDTF